MRFAQEQKGYEVLEASTGKSTHVEVVVSDTGISITAEFLPHVFECFRQGESGTTRERRVLGLAIARQLAEMDGGTINVRSAGAGHGSTFRVKLPLTVVHPSRDSEPRVHPRGNMNAMALEVSSVIQPPFTFKFGRCRNRS